MDYPPSTQRFGTQSSRTTVRLGASLHFADRRHAELLSGVLYGLPDEVLHASVDRELPAGTPRNGPTMPRELSSPVPNSGGPATGEQ